MKLYWCLGVEVRCFLEVVGSVFCTFKGLRKAPLKFHIEALEENKHTKLGSTLQNTLFLRGKLFNFRGVFYVYLPYPFGLLPGHQ